MIESKIFNINFLNVIENFDKIKNDFCNKTIDLNLGQTTFNLVLDTAISNSDCAFLYSRITPTEIQSFIDFYDPPISACIVSLDNKKFKVIPNAWDLVFVPSFGDLFVFMGVIFREINVSE